MTIKLIRLAPIAFVGCAFIAPLTGCGEGDSSSGKPTVDTSTPIKAPGPPAANKVEVAPKQ
jgi:hypothetical protein